MVFTSQIFVFYFLPLFLLLDYKLLYRSRNIWITPGSKVSYGWWERQSRFALTAMSRSAEASLPSARMIVMAPCANGCQECPIPKRCSAASG